MKKSNFIHNLFLLSILGMFTFSACTNSTSAGEEEHEDAEGFYLRSSGSNIVTQNPDEDLTGGITVQAGTETAAIEIFFIDHDGEAFQPEDDEDTLGYVFITDGIANPGSAEFEQHEEDGKWEFHIHGETAGMVYLRLMLMHDDHSDFDSQLIPITVTEAP